ncbi:MAG: hypothetical protein R6W80_01975 [Haliea sp.]
MKRMNLKRTLSTALSIGGPILTTSALAQSQDGHGMGSGGVMGGGYGGMWLPILVVIAVAGLVAWIVSQKRK